jgi:hypothetical protein
LKPGTGAGPAAEVSDDLSGLAGVYARKATWQEAMDGAREAMVARDAAWVAAGKGEDGGDPGRAKSGGGTGAAPAQ